MRQILKFKCQTYDGTFDQLLLSEKQMILMFFFCLALKLVSPLIKIINCQKHI